MLDEAVVVTQDPIGEDEQARLSRYKIDINRDADVTAEQRDKSNEDVRFVAVTGGTWEGLLDGHGEAYDGDKRVKMEFDMVNNFRQKLIGQWKENRVGVNYRSKSESSTDKDAEILEGLYRAAYRDGSPGRSAHRG